MIQLDLHNYEHRLRATLGRIRRDPEVRPSDKRLIEAYIRHCQARGLSPGRMFKLAWEMHALARLTPCALKVARRADIEKLVASINTSEKYSANSKSDLKKALKSLARFATHGNLDPTNPTLPQVSWISTAVKLSELTSEDIISEGEGHARAWNYDRAKILLHSNKAGGNRLKGFLLGQEI